MEIAWELIAPLIVLQFVLMIVALVSWFKDEDVNGPKWVWLLVILFVNIFGPILYFLVGRKK